MDYLEMVLRMALHVGTTDQWLGESHTTTLLVDLSLTG
jgi:hypothetical protein